MGQQLSEVMSWPVERRRRMVKRLEAQKKYEGEYMAAKAREARRKGKR
jgi:hypothetical protein